MGFKKINKENEKSIENIENKFLNNARGDKDESSKKDSSKISRKPFNEKLKRKYSISFYMDEDEFSEVKTKAEENKMNVNQYIRFKIFNANQN